jgi:CRP/FNR family transcriptional regulator, cyclic AMP receptor protein
MFSSLSETNLTRFAIFRALSDEQRATLISSSEQRVVPKSSLIFSPDDQCNFICLLVAGMVKTGSFFPDNREMIRSLLHPGAIFGETGLLGQKTREYFAMSMNSEVRYMAIPLDICIQIMEANFDFMLDVAHFAGERLRRAERQLESIISKDVRTRVIEFLKDNVVINEHAPEQSIDTLFKHGLTQQDIANIVGASRQTVAIILNDLRKSHLIEFDRERIRIHRAANFG